MVFNSKFLKYLSFAFCLGFSDGLANSIENQDKSQREFYQQRISRISDIETQLIVKERKNLLGEDEILLPIHGNAFVVGDYLFSLDHVVSRRFPTLALPGGFANFPLSKNILISEVYLDGTLIFPIVTRKKTDMAIFDLRTNPTLHKRYANDLTLDDLVLKDDIYVGMDIFYIARSLPMNDFYLEGKVAGFAGNHVKKIFQNSFYTSSPIVNGTSGKPVFTEIDGEKRIVGVAQYSFGPFGGVKLLDEYVDFIKSYEESFGDLDL